MSSQSQVSYYLLPKGLLKKYWGATNEVVTEGLSLRIMAAGSGRNLPSTVIITVERRWSTIFTGVKYVRLSLLVGMVQNKQKEISFTYLFGISEYS